MARAEAGQLLLGGSIPADRESQRLGLGRELEQDALVLDPRVKTQLTAGRRAAAQAQLVGCGEDDLGSLEPLGRAELLVHDHAFGQLDQLVVGTARRRP